MCKISHTLQMVQAWVVFYSAFICAVVCIDSNIDSQKDDIRPVNNPSAYSLGLTSRQVKSKASTRKCSKEKNYSPT